MKISECLGVNLRTNSYSYWWKPNTQFTVFGVIATDAFIHLCTWPQMEHGDMHQVPRGDSAGSKGWLLEDCLLTELCAMLQKQENLVLIENFYNHITSNIWLLNFPDCNSFDYCVIERETKKTPCNNKDELKARIKVARLSENLAGDSKVIWRLWLKPMVITLNKFDL